MLPAQHQTAEIQSKQRADEHCKAAAKQPDICVMRSNRESDYQT